MVFLQVLLFVAFTAGASAAEPLQKSSAADSLPPFAGIALRFVTPASGQRVAAGESLDVVIEVDHDVKLETAMVSYFGGGLLLQTPFRGRILIPRDRIGIMTLSALGKTTAGEMVISTSVNLEVEVRDARLLEIVPSEKHPELLGPGDVVLMRIYGEYSDGIKREVTNYQTSFTVVDGVEIACVTDDGAIIGRSPGAASVMVGNGALETLVPVIVGVRKLENNPPLAFLQYLYEGTLGETLCFSASGSRDYDACLGEPLGEESFQWELTSVSGTFEGVGREFCITPERVVRALLVLTVTDRHGATSKTTAIVVID